VIEAPFVNASPFADLIHAHATVAVIPEQLERDIHQLLFCITRATHINFAFFG
jgi:hypothetical protein